MKAIEKAIKTSNRILLVLKEATKNGKSVSLSEGVHRQITKAITANNEALASLQAESGKLEGLLNRTESELQKTCSCCGLFKDCHLPCKIDNLRTDIEQALKGR